MKHFNKLLLSAIPLTLSIQAVALEPYFLASVGQASTDIEGDIKDSDSYFSLGLGFDISDYMAAEISYKDFGKAADVVDQERISADSSAFSIGLLGKLPINGSIDLYAQAGLDIWDAEIGNLDDNGTDLFFGIGGNYAISQQSQITAGFERHSFGFNDSVNATKFKPDMDVDVILIGFKMNF
jgi:OOP family OmpA-OmpF porin